MHDGSSPTGEDGGKLEWRARPSWGGRMGLAASALTAACAVAAGAYALGRPVGLDSFVAALAGLSALLLAVLAGVLTHGYYSLRYRLGGQVLAIVWPWTRQIVPLGRVEQVLRGQRLGEQASVEGLTWPGCYLGMARAEGLGRLQFHGTTLDPKHALILATGDRAWAITPGDLDAFRVALFERLESLAEEEVEHVPEPQVEVAPWLRLSLLRDVVALGLMAAALLVLLASFGHVSARFPDLPELMALHFNAAGEPDLVGPRGDAFRMPIIGLVMLSANSVVAMAVHGWQRDAGRILAAATLFVELVMLMAVLRVVH